MNYLHWNEKTITDFSEKNISEMYARGYLFTRLGKGVMQQTRSVRIDLDKFAETSENRRILKKVEGMELQTVELPLREEYDWSIGKLAKDFYDAKFGPGIMSAQKVKEVLTDHSRSNFNKLLIYSSGENPIGYAISYSNRESLHYSYPFYSIETAPKDTGLGMMIMAIRQAKDVGIKHVYLGSLQRPADTYKLQFEGLEWFDGKKWQTDITAVKKVLSSVKM